MGQNNQNGSEAPEAPEALRCEDEQFSPGDDIEEKEGESREKTARRCRKKADQLSERARRAHSLSITFLQMAQDLQDERQSIDGDSEQRLRRRIEQLQNDSRFYRREAEHLQSEADSYHDKARELIQKVSSDNSSFEQD